MSTYPSYAPLTILLSSKRIHLNVNGSKIPKFQIYTTVANKAALESTILTEVQYAQVIGMNLLQTEDRFTQTSLWTTLRA